MNLVKEDERGQLYEADGIEYVTRGKDTISANHQHPEHEDLFLLEGEAELTIADETQKIQGPIRVQIPPNAYHKIVALTPIKLLADKSIK